MIKNVIFDLGNVLLNFNPIQYLHEKIDDEEKVREVFKEIFLSEEWVMLDKGVITEKEAIRRICSRSNENDHFIRLAMNNWYEMLTPIENSVEFLKELKNKGYNLYYLSNFHMLAFEIVTKKYNFFKLFSGGVVSYKENLLKPDKSIYEKLIDRYKINPQESVFIDDTLVNIEGAKKLEFEVIHFTDIEDLKKLKIS